MRTNLRDGTLVLYQFCTASVRAHSCFPLRCMLSSNGNQNMKSQSRLRHSSCPRACPLQTLASNLAPSPTGAPQSPHITRSSRNQSLAKHNRKPSQLTENKHHEPKSIASSCRVFCRYAARRPTFSRHRAVSRTPARLSSLITRH